MLIFQVKNKLTFNVIHFFLFCKSGLQIQDVWVRETEHLLSDRQGSGDLLMFNIHSHNLSFFNMDVREVKGPLWRFLVLTDLLRNRELFCPGSSTIWTLIDDIIGVLLWWCLSRSRTGFKYSFLLSGRLNYFKQSPYSFGFLTSQIPWSAWAAVWLRRPEQNRIPLTSVCDTSTQEVWKRRAANGPPRNCRRNSYVKLIRALSGEKFNVQVHTHTHTPARMWCKAILPWCTHTFHSSHQLNLHILSVNLAGNHTAKIKYKQKWSWIPHMAAT